MKLTKQWFNKLAVVCLLVLAMCTSSISMTSFAAKPDGSQIMVSLGDSYSSGEGIEPFYGQDEQNLDVKVTNPDWLAHRSTKAWPGMLKLPTVPGTMANNRRTADNPEGNWLFVAASSAETVHLKTEQSKYAVKAKRIHLNPLEYSDDDFAFHSASLDPQLAITNRLMANETVDYVTLTLGGNDADFVGIISSCALHYFDPSNVATKLNSTWDHFFQEGGIRDNLYNSYHDIQSEFGKQAKIIVAGYPQLLSAVNPITGVESATLINENVTKFNNAIQSIVNHCRDEGLDIHFVPVENAFKGHAAYSVDAYINDVMLLSRKEDIDDGAWPPISAYSIHPNEKGAQAYAECVQAKIDELETTHLAGNTYNTEFKLAVYDVNDQLYDNYSVDIEGKQYGGLFKTGLFKDDYTNSFEISSKESVAMSMPKGDYTITIVDKAGSRKSYRKDIQVRPKSKMNNLVFETDMGSPEAASSESISVEPISGARNIVLTLDVSGSMAGTPLDETKKASIKFIETVLKEDASTGIVTYDDESVIASGFSKSRATLERIVTELQDGGATNIEAGLRDAQWMLDKNNAKKDFIVLMSDGEPNSGKVGDELIAYANEIKEAGTKIYTLGFFESLGDKSEAQYLMEQIASKGCHYEVASAEDLVFFFEDMADQINGQKYIYVRIACPVDVKVSHDGETLCSSENDLNTRTSFGTLTFEDSQSGSDEETTTEEADIITEDSVKVLRLKTGVDYDLEINGTGTGHMDYTIGFMDDDGEYSDMRHIDNVKITRDTVINTVATEADENIMDVDEDGDGQADYSYRVGKNGQGELVEPETVSNNRIVVIVIVALIILLLLLLLALLKRPKK